LLLAVGATEDGLQELERGYFLEWDDEGHLWLHDLLQEYWLDEAINEAVKELGDEFKDKLDRGEVEKPIRIRLTRKKQSPHEKEQEKREDTIYAVLSVGKSKLSDWLLAAAEWSLEQGNYLDIRRCVPWHPSEAPFCLAFMASKKLEEGDIAEAERLWLKALPGLEEFAFSDEMEEYLNAIVNLADFALERKEVTEAREYYVQGLQMVINYLLETPSEWIFECNEENVGEFILNDVNISYFLENLLNFIIEYVGISQKVEKIKADIDIMIEALETNSRLSLVIEGYESDSELAKEAFISRLQELLDLLQETSEDFENH